MKPEKKIFELGEHDAGLRILATTRYNMPERTWQGKTLEAVDHVSVLADIRLECIGWDDENAFREAAKIAQALHDNLERCDDGEVSIEISYIEAGVNW